MQNLTDTELEILRFLRRTFQIPPYQMKAELNIFLQKIKKLEAERYQTRVFVYLDIVSWVEHKVYNKPMSVIIGEKFNARMSRKQKQL
jgi:hypothetical protein